MNPRVDTEDLIDAASVAQLLGLAKRTSVSVYQQRYPDMPRPIVDLGAGRSRLWSRRAVEVWMATVDRRAPQEIVKPELEAMTLIGERYAQGIFRSMYATARQHGLGRGKQRRELPTRRAAYEAALAEALKIDPDFRVTLPPEWLDQGPK
jgi:glutathione-regulated potassium-efflux system ancillary protein KefG